MLKGDFFAATCELFLRTRERERGIHMCREEEGQSEDKHILAQLILCAFLRNGIMTFSEYYIIAHARGKTRGEGAVEIRTWDGTAFAQVPCLWHCEASHDAFSFARSCGGGGSRFPTAEVDIAVS